jgi:hypothetical protein
MTDGRARASRARRGRPIERRTPWISYGRPVLGEGEPAEPLFRVPPAASSGWSPSHQPPRWESDAFATEPFALEPSDFEAR